MIISLNGKPGSGKSTIAKLLSEYLDIPHYSVGDIRGQMAKERGMTIDEFNKLGETEDFTDKEVDAYQKKLGESGQSFIADGRMSWYFIPKSFKIFLDVKPEIGAKRIYKSCEEGARPDERKYTSIKDAKDALMQRIISDADRYKKYYGVDYLDLSKYDLIIDTCDKSPEEIVKLIIEKIK